MKTSKDYKKQMAKALDFIYKFPAERAVAAARIYKANESTTHTNLQRTRQRGDRSVMHGGYNKILS